MPHNLIAAQESPVHLPKFQMTPRLNILIPLGPRKEPRYTILFPQTVLACESPAGSPLGPLWREIPTYRAFLHLSQFISFYLSLRVPGKGAPSMFPNRVPMDRDTPSPEPLVYLLIHSFIHVCLPESPKWSPHTYGEKHKVTLHRAPRRQKVYTHWGSARFPNWIISETAVSIPVPSLSLLQCHADLGMIPSTLAWVGQSPISQRES